MKSRIATYLMAMFMFFGGTAFALNPVPTPRAETPKSEKSKIVGKLLQQELKYPKFAKAEKFECCVLVRISIEEDGSFTVDCANCTSNQMKAHVTKAIEQIDKKEMAKFAGNQFSYKINFRLI